MTNKALLVRVEAKPGQEDKVADFLRQARTTVEEEEGTVTWFALRLSDSEFGIFDAFDDDDARQAHLSGPIGQALSQRSEELFANPPSVEPVDVLADKLP